MHRNFVSILAAGAMLAAWADTTPQTEWESAMCVHRPHLSAKETRSPRTLAVAFAGKIGGASVSGSSQLVKTDGGWQVTLYAPPKPTAKPPFEGWCETFDVTLSFGDANVVSDVSLE